MPKCKINGQELEVKQGTTIIEAYKLLDENIAHYCWHPGLSIAGVCRLCMVEIEGNPRLQIACNTVITEGMVINNNSEKVKETVRWGLDFHLINHPLDCPICDQAGECGLQEQYMEYGKYTPEMAERKVKKRKVVDLGPTVMLDSERCILCSRCVRFTEEVSKTNELGIFNRGDRSEIGTFKDRPLDNKYSLNTVDICPVGALTSKDFRFRQRVWYLKEVDSICTGCSTGCSIKGYYNEEGMWRVKPRFNENVNGHWMCDEGRGVYKIVNKETRWQSAQWVSGGQTKELSVQEVLDQIRKQVEASGSEKTALVLTGQYTVEEYNDILQAYIDLSGNKNVYHWMNRPEQAQDFDGLLLRGDRNPNTNGLIKALKVHGISTTWTDLETMLAAQKLEMVIVAGPENLGVFDDVDAKVAAFSKANYLAWLGAPKIPALQGIQNTRWFVPLKTFIEKSGTYINFEGREQKVKAGPTFVKSAVTLSAVAAGLKGQDWTALEKARMVSGLKTNHFTRQRGEL